MAVAAAIVQVPGHRSNRPTIRQSLTVRPVFRPPTLSYRRRCPKGEKTTEVAPQGLPEPLRMATKTAKTRRRRATNSWTTMQRQESLRAKGPLQVQRASRLRIDKDNITRDPSLACRSNPPGWSFRSAKLYNSTLSTLKQVSRRLEATTRLPWNVETLHNLQCDGWCM